VLDLVGPFEGLTKARKTHPELRDSAGGRVAQIDAAPVSARHGKGMRIPPDDGFEDAPAIDVLLVPAVAGTRSEADG
jgi:hypothetical protein